MKAKLPVFVCIARDGDSRGYRNAESAARELTRSIRREVTRLSETWISLLNRSDHWQHRLEETVSVNYRCFLVFAL